MHVSVGIRVCVRVCVCVCVCVRVCQRERGYLYIGIWNDLTDTSTCFIPVHKYTTCTCIHVYHTPGKHAHLFHGAIETKTSKPNNSASTDQPDNLNYLGWFLLVLTNHMKQVSYIMSSGVHQRCTPLTMMYKCNYNVHIQMYKYMYMYM